MGHVVRLISADTAACGHYRIKEPIRVTAGTPGWDIRHGYAPARDTTAEVVVIQRPLHRLIVERYMPEMQAKGIAVVVEIDDDFAALPAGNLAFLTSHPRMDADQNIHWLRKAAAIADLVTCTTPALAARYAPHGRAAVIPNYVPAAYLDLPPRGDGRTIGWAGNLHFHPGDLDVCGPAVRIALANTSGRFLGIGDPRIGKTLGLDDADHQPFVPLDEYPAQLARFDIGLVPLQDIAFNKAKSALKMLEYAACGVFPIGSPTPDNLRLHEQYGLGAIAKRPKDWARLITRWLNDDDARHRAVLENRAIIADRLTVERNGDQWLAAWSAAVTYRQSHAA